MKRALTLLALLALVGTVSASVPDPDYCTVSPMDNMPVPRLIGIPAGTAQAGANLTVHVAAFGGDPIPDALVEVYINGQCDDLCLCTGVVLTGYTNAQGNVTINGRFGGCCTEPSSCIVIAEGTNIRDCDVIVSPDYDGAAGNCATSGTDFVFFGQNWGVASGVVCADYTGDGACSGVDFVTFGAAWGLVCTPQP